MLLLALVIQSVKINLYSTLKRHVRLEYTTKVECLILVHSSTQKRKNAAQHEEINNDF